MTRRERLERKLEKRLEWAEKREAHAETALDSAFKQIEHIPMGQPILVGHHSERRHRRDLERHDSLMRRAHESREMAQHHAEKAAGLERQLDDSIFSDDPDAIEQIEARIAELENEREKNNAINKIVRRSPKNEPTPEKLAALAAIGFSESAAAEVFKRDFCGRIGIAGYVNQNISGNIARLKKRIESIKIRQARTARAEAAGGVVIEKCPNGEHAQVTFSEKPERPILDSLRAAGFHWSGGSWFGLSEKLPECVNELV